MITEFFAYFGLLALMFFAVSLLTKGKFWYLTVALNLSFLAVFVLTGLRFVGTPIPYQYNIPLLKMEKLNVETFARIETGFLSGDLIYLVLDTKGGMKLVSIKKSPEFIAAFNEMLKKTQGKFGAMVNTDTLYEGGTGSPFMEADGTQDNMAAPKTGGPSEVEDAGNVTDQGGDVN